MKPTVGRIVHYFAEGNSKDEGFSGPYAAIVVALGPEPSGDQPQTVDLAVWFSPAAAHPKYSVPLVDEPAKHCCTWPPRV